ncbi:MAG TPA: FHA domain-containing protein [Kofleriaceae bacterium]|nr:FHA domain-containing protein [Kofleriaceae bacterium]
MRTRFHGRRRLGVPAISLTASLIAGLFATTPARADREGWKVVEVLPGDRGPDGAVPPHLRVQVTGVPAPASGERKAWRLKDVDGHGTGIAASRVIQYAQSNETLAVVLLVEGAEYYLGNGRYTVGGAGDAHPAIAGIYDALSAALDAPAAAPGDVPRTLRNAGPPGSLGELIVYAGTADVRAPMGDLRRLDAAALGPEELQRGHNRRDLAEGLRTAQADLHRVTASRKALIVISDGVTPAGVDGVVPIKRMLDRDHVETVALHLEVPSDYLPTDAKARRSAERVMKTLGGDHYLKVTSPRALASDLALAVREPLEARFWLEFPGGPPAPGRLPRGPTWDGAEHQLVLLHDGEPLADATVAAVLPAPPHPGARRGWLWPIAGALGGVGVLALVVVARTRRRTKGAAGAAPVAAAPQPIAWLIPLEGPLQDQPFRLDRPVTRVGTAADAEVRFTDPAVSRDHAAIERAPGGFVLVDHGSTNGTSVNQVRIDRRLLADQDVITIGAIRCRFRTG